MTKEIKNQYGVKIGNIFYLDNYGRVNFFQVVKLRGKSQVVVREIEFEKIGENNFKEDMVIPILNHFRDKSFYIEDNNIGMSKNLQKHEEKENIYISFNYFFNRNQHGELWQKMSIYDEAYLWDGKPKISYLHYY